MTIFDGAGPSSRGRNTMSRLTVPMVAATFLLSWGSRIEAQYSADIPIEFRDENRIRYFGSVKDAAGNRLRDVTVLIENRQSSYVFATDGSGRYSGFLPLTMPVATARASCNKSGYRSVRVQKRASIVRGRRAVQVDCVLAPANTR